MTDSLQSTAIFSQIKTKEKVSDFLVELHGNLDQTFVTSTLKQINDVCSNFSYPSSFTTRLKTISVEILQNISKHKHESHEFSPYFVLGSNNEGIFIYSGNLVTRLVKNIISERLDVYNELESDELRDFYRYSLRHTSISEQGNAGIGLLDIVYRSKQKIKYSFTDFENEFSYFELYVLVSNSID